jgi:hypothetical protein
LLERRLVSVRYGQFEAEPPSMPRRQPPRPHHRHPGLHELTGTSLRPLAGQLWLRRVVIDDVVQILTERLVVELLAKAKLHANHLISVLVIVREPSEYSSFVDQPVVYGGLRSGKLEILLERVRS